MRTKSFLFPAAAVALSAVLVTAAPARAGGSVQFISLDANSGDGSVSGHAQLTAVPERGGHRVRGTVTSFSGCVRLAGVQMYWGARWGGDPIGHACGTDHTVSVDCWTGHGDVVLTAVVPDGLNYDSRIVRLS